MFKKFENSVLLTFLRGTWPNPTSRILKRL